MLEHYGKSYKKKGTQRRAYTTAICHCGNHFEALLDNVKRENTKSCGCYKEKHNCLGTRTYKSWQGVKERCLNKNNQSYSSYGGRGIGFCDRWKKFSLFLEDMGECPIGMSLDRIENSGNYEPTNCRWATPTEQANNRRSNLLITLGEETNTLAEWCRIYNINYKNTWHLLRKNTLEDIVSKI